MLGSLEEKILSCYNEIDLGTCEVCTRCHSDNPTLYSKAVGMWFVGKFFEGQKNRVLFIGKNARGMPATEYKENQNNNGFLAEFRYSRENLIDKSWPYWSYTKEISKRLFGDMVMEAVAFTNMVKCNGSDTIDTTTESMKGYCIGDLAVVRREIEIIKPTHIVLYTGTFRGHGFRGRALIPMLKAYVGKVDWLICEGTMLSRGPETVKSERQLQGDERSLMEQNKRVFVVCSSMNIDRIAGFCKAVPDRRPILCDDFQKKALDIV